MILEDLNDVEIPEKKKVKTEIQKSINPFPQDEDDENFKSLSEDIDEESDSLHLVY